MVSSTSLSIEGYRGEPVPHTFFQQADETDHGVISFPGWGYTAQMPLLFYSLKMMVDLKGDALSVEYAYNLRQDFQALDEEEKIRWFVTDVRSAYQALLSQRAYRQITLIGKSLGTRAMGYVLTGDDLPETVRAVWLTPLLKDDTLRGQIRQYGGRSLFISGTADPFYEAGYMAEVQYATNGQVVLIDDADHSLNIANDVKKSIQTLEMVVDRIETFVST